MDIGTGKDLSEYTQGGQRVPYHLVDSVQPGEKYHVRRFQQEARQAIEEIRTRGKQPILCGGTGLYIEALLHDYALTGVPINEPLRAEYERHSTEALLQYWEQYRSYHQTADTSTRKRLIRALEVAEYLAQNPGFTLSSTPLHYQVFGLNPATELRRERITKRLHARLEQGLVAEVERLLAQGLTSEQLIYYGLEYKYVTEYLVGQLTYDTMVARLNTEIHRFAKRQMTYFRKMERSGIPIHWLPTDIPLSDQLFELSNRLTH
jgi:tRNA dimethylallyltransferase